MDLSNFSTSKITQNSTSINRKRKCEEYIFAGSKRTQFLSTYNYCQAWSLPETIIHYIAKNPSNSKVHQCCKYFFIKNPILILKSLEYENGKWYTYSSKEKDQKIVVKNISSKIWVTDEFKHYGTSTKHIPTFVPQLFRIDAKKLDLQNQTIQLNVFLFFSRSVEDIFLSNVMVQEKGGSIVKLEKLVKYLPKVTRITFDDNALHSSITSKTVKKLIKLPNISKIKSFDIYNIPEAFDIEAFFAYLKEIKHTKCYLWFDNENSKAYKKRLEAIIDEIIETTHHEYEIPYITFDPLDFYKFTQIYTLAYTRY